MVGTMHGRRDSEPRAPRLRRDGPQASPRVAAEQFLSAADPHPALTTNQQLPDGALVTQLQETVECQRVELERREEMIAALQRNLSNLSNIPRPDPSDHHKEDHARVLQQLSKLTKELEEERKESDTLRRNMEHAMLLQGCKSDLESTNQALAVKVNDLQKELAGLTKVSSDRMKRLGEAKRHAERCEKRVNAAETTVAEAESKVKQAEASADAARKEAQINQAEMWEQKKKWQEATQRGVQLEEDIRGLQQGNAELRRQCQQLEHKLAAAEAEAEQWKVSSRRNAMESNGTLEELVAQLEAANKGKATADTEVETLRRGLDGAREELLQYKQQANASEADALSAEERVGELEEELSRVQGERKDLQSELQVLRASNTEAVEQALQINALNEQIERLKEQEMKALTEQEKLRRGLDGAREELLQYKQQANAAEADALSAEERIGELEEELSRVQSKVEALEAKTRELEAGSSALTEAGEKKLEGMAQEIKLLQEANAELETKVQQAAPSKKTMFDAVTKLQGASESMEGILTCMGCMELFKEPMTLHPCGHTFCKNCCESSKEIYGQYQCEECGDTRPVESLSNNCLLDELCGKFTYQKQVLDGLQATAIKAGWSASSK